MSTISTTSRKEFEEKVLNNPKTVLVDFWAAWCMPCKMMAPVLEKVSEDLADQLDVVKVNVEESDENMALAQDYKVQGIPNMQLFRNGEVINTIIGAYPEPVLVEEIKKTLDS